VKALQTGEIFTHITSRKFRKAYVGSLKKSQPILFPGGSVLSTKKEIACAISSYFLLF